MYSECGGVMPRCRADKGGPEARNVLLRTGRLNVAAIRRFPVVTRAGGSSRLRRSANQAASDPPSGYLWVMPTFTAMLVSGDKAPYERWTFLDVPPEIGARFGRRPAPVVGSVEGTAFRSMMHRASSGSYRVALRKESLPPGFSVGDPVSVTMEIDPEPRRVEIPAELAAVFAQHPEVAELFERMAPSHRRAWAAYVGDAKQEATRIARAAKAPAGIRGREFPR